MRRGAVLLALLVTALGSRSAQGYVRSQTDNRKFPKIWAEGCIPVTIYLNGFDKKSVPHMSVDAIVKSVTAAAHAWSPDVVQCRNPSTQPYLEIVPTLAPLDAKPPAATDDHKNSIIFRTDSWSRSGDPKNTPYSNGALAVTTVTALPNGQIEDADIEVNAVALLGTWANLDPGVPPPDPGPNTQDFDTFDLQSALTHEFGHLLGLDHTCFNPAEPGGNIAEDGSPRPKDNANNNVPDCAPNPPALVEQAIMFSKIDSLSIKRVLTQDDEDFLCDVYPTPVNSAPPACRVDQPNAGCAMAPTPARRGGARSRTLGLFGVGGLVLAAVTRRARRLSARAKARS